MANLEMEIIDAVAVDTDRPRNQPNLSQSKGQERPLLKYPIKKTSTNDNNSELTSLLKTSARKLSGRGGLPETQLLFEQGPVEMQGFSSNKRIAVPNGEDLELSPTPEKIVTLEGITAEKRDRNQTYKIRQANRSATRLSGRSGDRSGEVDQSPGAELGHSGSEDAGSVLSTDSRNGIFNDTLQ